MSNFLTDIRQIIQEARTQAVRSVNYTLTVMYWHIGQRIVEEEQQGKERADYKTYLLKDLANMLKKEFGDGFSRRQLELMRQLYLVFPNANALSSHLTWTHYKHLIRLDDADKRAFYIAEATKNAWTVRNLERQIHSPTSTAICEKKVLPIPKANGNLSSEQKTTYPFSQSLPLKPHL